MVLPKNTVGRPCSSRSGTVPVDTNCSNVPVITSGIGGQPETLMIGLLRIRSDTGRAPVGFGLGNGMPPNDEQVPTQMMAAAPSAASVRMSTAVRPAAQSYTPPSAVGTEPSTTTMYLP